jgi:hypothetical protein
MEAPVVEILYVHKASTRLLISNAYGTYPEL